MSEGVSRRWFLAGAVAAPFVASLPGALFRSASPAVLAHLGSGGIAVGDTFTIAGVHAVNPITGAALPGLQRFIVTAALSE